MADKPITTKNNFRERMEQVINNTKRLRMKYDAETVKAVLTKDILDKALTHLTRLGKVAKLFSSVLRMCGEISVLFKKTFMKKKFVQAKCLLLITEKHI